MEALAYLYFKFLLLMDRECVQLHACRAFLIDRAIDQ